MAKPRPELSILKACAIAQFLSVLIAITGITSEVLVLHGLSAPTTQSFLNYCLVASYSLLMLWRTSPSGRIRLRNPWYIYLGLAFLDVEGNFLVTTAYQFTSITSVTLLDSATIPAVMVLSYFFLRSRYNSGHLIGSVLCCGGLVLLVLTDGGSATGGAHPILGDVLVISGACIYAVCNVAQEKLLGQETSRWELLTMVGGFAALISGCQAYLLERDQWSRLVLSGSYSLPGPPSTVVPGMDITAGDSFSPPPLDPVQEHWIIIFALVGFAVSLFLFSVLLPSVLILGSSTVLNLSLLTSDLWSAVARMTLFGGFGGTAWAFCAALIAESVGLTIYAMSGATHVHHDEVGFDEIRRHARREYADELDEAAGADVEGLLVPDSPSATGPGSSAAKGGPVAEDALKGALLSSFGSAASAEEGGPSCALLQTDSGRTAHH